MRIGSEDAGGGRTDSGATSAQSVTGAPNVHTTRGGWVAYELLKCPTFSVGGIICKVQQLAVEVVCFFHLLFLISFLKCMWIVRYFLIETDKLEDVTPVRRMP